MRTLEEARTYIKENLDEGVTCPCCHQTAKRYVRKLNSGLASALCIAYAQFGTNPFHVPSLRGLPGFSEFSKLRYWALAQQEEEKGYWRITSNGRFFAEGYISVPQFAVLFDSELEHLKGENINVREALGDHFDYDQLMAQR